MKIVTAEFIRSCHDPGQWPRGGLPEVAFVGRSNVGKSLLINSLLHRKGLAKVSATPGKTRILNFFRVTTAAPVVKTFSVVDLPGYGYAKVAKSVRARWGPMIERYLTGRAELRGVILLVDARGVERHDQMTFEWLNGLKQRTAVVATKVDKLTRSERRKSLAAIREALGLPEAIPLVPYSSITHEGRDELWQTIREMLQHPA
ncbi:MAG: YihA family ribosome biogenesis GTP-binding protein [Nitrospirae bacterium]|nr:YihA family ribosome biogenesis GTP-binding protein [Nitrospirota bacterium]